MDEIHYLISDASKKVDVEAHVLRYWEEELGLDIPRNEMGHRYYTDLHIRLFRQIKNLKEKGYQLKAIKHALNQVLEKEGRMELSDEMLERDMDAALKEFREEDKPGALAEVKDGAAVLSMEEKMACGIGACLACVCNSTEVDGHSLVHNKRICKDGPVFLSTEVEL